MKIYYLSASLMPSSEANCVNVTRMCASFAELGHEVTLFARRNGEQQDEEVLERHGIAGKVRLHRVGNPGWPAERTIGYPLSVLKVLRRLPPPDLIYGRDVYSMLAASLALPRVPLMYDMHDLATGFQRRHAERLLFRRRAFLTAFVVSEALMRQYRELNPDMGGLDLALSRNGADTPVDVAPASLGGRPGARRFGYVGHLYPGKGMETVELLAQRLPQADFHVVGGRDAELAAWRARTAALPNILYHGFVAHTQVQSYLAAMDTLLAPPLPVTKAASGLDIGSWMSPLKIFEYMAAGRPIVASDIPVVREILRDGATALLVSPGDGDAWMAALRRLEDPVFAAQLARQSRADLEERFTWMARARAALAHFARRQAHS